MNIIPRPQEVTESAGEFIFGKNININGDNISEEFLDFLRQRIQKYLDISFGLKPNPVNSILVRLDENTASQIPEDESYNLDISPEVVHISASNESGLLYGVHSFIQQCQAGERPDKSFRIPCQKIYDKPRYNWRGMHLDVSRHFFSVSEVKKFLDLLSLLKFNRFHWHLTDDQGWRVEIKKYPRLTEVGGDRNLEDDSRYGGFYSQDEIKEIVAYANRLNIAIVPEIDIPGHVQAALAAYPEYSCDGKPVDVWNEWGISRQVLCVGNEKTTSFITAILDEICDLFPGDHIHIGGDECPTDSWQSCDKCLELVGLNQLNDVNELQNHFLIRIINHLKTKNKIVIGWDEIADHDIDQDTIVMVWRGWDKASEAVKKNHQVILCPTSHCYFDYYQSENNEPKAIGGLLPLEKVYTFNPSSFTDDTGIQQFILGGQANLWTEYIHDFNHLMYMALPRAMAMAEALWTEDVVKNYPEFKQRLYSLTRIFDRLGIAYRPLD